MADKLPFSVRATDVFHRVTVLGLVGICVVGLGSISFNIWANSDYGLNRNKLTFQKEDYEEARKKSEE